MPPVISLFLQEPREAGVIIQKRARDFRRPPAGAHLPSGRWPFLLSAIGGPQALGLAPSLIPRLPPTQATWWQQ